MKMASNESVGAVCVEDVRSAEPALHEACCSTSIVSLKVRLAQIPQLPFFRPMWSRLANAVSSR